MSVLIKGMEMPKNCYVCEFITFDDGWICKRLKRKIINVTKCNPKDKDCPLVEVPVPHGRLIDGDALKETLDYYICEANWGDEVNKALRWVKDEFINSENTVIEAEGSED